VNQSPDNTESRGLARASSCNTEDDMQTATNVVPFPEPPAKTIPASSAGPWTFLVWAATDRIGGDWMETIYREELVVCDPDAALENDCLVVFQFAKGQPHVNRWWLTGRDHNGRFGPAGDQRECFMLSCGLRCARGEELRIIRILGRVVGEPRRLAQ
jgi:hypothetical protein